jgi:hypothetical protein
MTTALRPGSGYPSTVVARAVELGDAGWSAYAIPGHLEKEFGVRPQDSTVRRWLDPRIAERERRRTRQKERARRQQIGMRMIVVDDDRKLELMRRLDDEGMSVAAVAKALRVFTGDSITYHQVRHALQTGRYPQRVTA